MKNLQSAIVLTVRMLTLVLAVRMFAGAARQRRAARKEARRETSRRLRQLRWALIRYISHNDNYVLPDMTSAETLRQALAPHIDDQESFVQAVTGEPFQPNPLFSKKSLREVNIGLDNWGSYVMLYQTSPSPNRTRLVVFGNLDGKRISESDWPALKLKSKIP